MGATAVFACFAIVLLPALPSMPCPGAVSERMRHQAPKQQTLLNLTALAKMSLKIAAPDK